MLKMWKKYFFLPINQYFLNIKNFSSNSSDNKTSLLLTNTNVVLSASLESTLLTKVLCFSPCVISEKSFLENAFVIASDNNVIISQLFSFSPLFFQFPPPPQTHIIQSQNTNHQFYYVSWHYNWYYIDRWEAGWIVQPTQRGQSQVFSHGLSAMNVCGITRNWTCSLPMTGPMLRLKF